MEIRKYSIGMSSRVSILLRSALIVGAIVVGLPICCFALFLGYIGISEIRCNLTTGQADKWMKSSFEEIVSISDDVPIEGDLPQVSIAGGSTLWLTGRGTQVFGTQRTYEEVVRDYEDWLVNAGWIRGEIPNDAEFSFYKSMGATHYFYLPGKAYSREFAIAPAEASDASTEYATTYLLHIQVFAYLDYCDLT